MKTRDSDDDVLLQAIPAATQQRRAWYCLDMSASCYTVSFWPAHSLWNGLQNSDSVKNPNIKQSCRPEPHTETMRAALENNSTYKNRRGSAVVPPPVARNLRSRQECARALPRLISEQISIRRQVWSAYPHSCSCLRLYYYVQEPFTMWRVVKLECWHNKTLRKVCPRTLFNNTSCSPCCALFPVPKFPSSHMVPKFHILCLWNQGISFHSVSPCFALVWEGRMRPLWTKGSVCKVQMTF